MYNPYGKYVFKFYINGGYRIVTIDDRILTNEGLSTNCAYSFQGEELWVTLIEKAVLKVKLTNNLALWWLYSV